MASTTLMNPATMKLSGETVCTSSWGQASCMTPREMIIEVRDARLVTLLKYREPGDGPLSEHEQRELNLWLESVSNYIQISHKTSLPSRLWKWFLNRCWLRMSPSGRRTAFFVICAEGLSLVFFLLILGWLRIFKTL